MLEDENTNWITTYKNEIENHYTFIYEKQTEKYSYYIPTEIKDIIHQKLSEIEKESKQTKS